jgi:CDP-6-deoxy-D-xylo-4-hexulose-3-dehydrase
MIFVTHLLGFSADIEAYKEIFPKALIIEDICESHGVKSPTGERRGAESLGATFSFYFGHHMTTVEGGVVSTRDEELYELMRIKRSHGLARELPFQKFLEAMKNNPYVDSKFMFLTDGYNFRNTELGAVLGTSQLKRLDKAIEIRNRNYKMFLNALAPYADHFHMPVDSDTNSSYAFPIVAKNKKTADQLKFDLDGAGIETRPIVSGNLLLQPFLKNYSLEDGSKMHIKTVHENGVYVGNNQLIGRSEIEMLSDVLANTVGK